MATTPLDLITDEAFVQRVVVAFASVAHGALTPSNPAPPDVVRKGQLDAVRYLAAPVRTRKLVEDSMSLVVASPEVLAALAQGQPVSDANLVTVATRILGAYTEYVGLGGVL